MEQEREEERSIRGASGEHTKRDTPPPFGERQERLAPIIFRAIKVEKSSPQETIIFRTKNPEKSRLGLIGKNFGKNLWENVSGKRKAPNLMERGRSAKIRKIDLRVQR